jgi:hypothetical protein
MLQGLVGLCFEERTNPLSFVDVYLAVQSTLPSLFFALGLAANAGTGVYSPVFQTPPWLKERRSVTFSRSNAFHFDGISPFLFFLVVEEKQYAVEFSSVPLWVRWCSLPNFCPS